MRILATHHTKFLWSADSAILFKDGAIVSQGPPEEVLGHKDFVGKDYDAKDVAMAIDGEVRIENNCSNTLIEFVIFIFKYSLID